MKDYKKLIDTLRRCVNSEKCGSCPLAKEPGCRKTLSLSAADAIEELLPLERDKAKTPYMESDGYADGAPVWDYFCPTCDEPFEDSRPNYCPNCGQKILWEGEE